MRLIKLHRVLVVGGAALVASCGGSDDRQQQAATTVAPDAAANDERGQPSGDAAARNDAQGVDTWLSWVTADAGQDSPATSDAEIPTEDAADAAVSDAGNSADSMPGDAQGVDAWLSWA
jgi:hypothetical protein